MAEVQAPKVGDYVHYEYLPGTWRHAQILRIARKYVTIRTDTRHPTPRKVLREKLEPLPYTPMSELDAHRLITEIRQRPGWDAKVGSRDSFTSGWTVEALCHSCWRRCIFYGRETWLRQLEIHGH